MLRSVFCRAIMVAVMLLAFAPHLSAQRVAIKTNALDYLILSPNLTVEAQVSRVLSVQLGVATNPLSSTIKGVKLSNFRVEPEIRYWFNRPMARHFVALSMTGATCSLQFDDRHISGDAVAAGLSYGYALVLSRHWNMEAEIGLGLAHFRGYDYKGTIKPIEKNCTKLLPVPIRLGLSFSYVFK